MEIFPQILLILLGFFLVFLNGFFVASEFSIVKVRETRIQELVQRGAPRALTARSLIRKMDEYLSATQLGITLASLGLGWIGEPAFARLFEPLFQGFGARAVVTHSLAATCAFLLITFLHIVLGELAPKSVAIQRSEPVVLWIARPLVWFYTISYPFIWALNGTANFCLRVFGVPPVSESEKAHSEEELRLIISYAHEKGVLGREEKTMLERVFSFADRSVHQVMLPATEVVFLDLQKSLEENLALAKEHEHTRYPLCDGSLDRVVGVVHVKDLFWKYHQAGPDFDLRSMGRPVRYVPDTKLIISLLTEFRQSRIHLAIVVDEHGAMIGIVTLEDVLEELVGEIQDEFDLEIPGAVRKIDEQHYLLPGRALLEEIEHPLEISIYDEENDTIGGHVMMLLGRTAKVGDEVIVAGKFRVRVVGMKGMQITELLLEIPKDE